MSEATLRIEDSQVEGAVNIHYEFSPALDEASPAHALMARVLENLKSTIAEQTQENLHG